MGRAYDSPLVYIEHKAGLIGGIAQTPDLQTHFMIRTCLHSRSFGLHNLQSSAKSDLRCVNHKQVLVCNYQIQAACAKFVTLFVVFNIVCQ